MEQIVIQVADKEKALMLTELLSSLNFITSIVVKSEEDKNEVKLEESTDFFELAGLWQDRNVDLESIRKKAWPRQQ